MIIFWIFWCLAVSLLLVSGLILLYGAPYMPTLRKQQQDALNLLNLKPGQVIYDLGCGDGRLLRVAAERGLSCVGYELNPFIVIAAKIVTWPQRRQVKIIWGNYWKADVSEADGIFVFLLDKYMPKLDKLISKQFANKPVRLVSHAFKIPGRQPAAKKGALFLYEYNPRHEQVDVAPKP